MANALLGDTAIIAYFVPYIRNLKDQQIYGVYRHVDYGMCTPWLTKTADLGIVEEQRKEMIQAALSRQQRTVPTHGIVLGSATG